MSARFMLDTDTVSFALRGVDSVRSRLLELHPSEVCISVLTLAELRFGADRKRSKRLHSLIDTFVASVRPVVFDENAAAAFGPLANALLDRGAPIGHLDTLIAAHALALNVVLLTNNTRHFSRVRGLRTESWAEQ